jgi:hypothetical protein
MPRVRVEQRSELSEEGGSASDTLADEQDILEQADALVSSETERRRDGETERRRDGDLQPNAVQRPEPALQLVPSPPQQPLWERPRSHTLQGELRMTSTLDDVSTPANRALALLSRPSPLSASLPLCASLSASLPLCLPASLPLCLSASLPLSLSDSAAASASASASTSASRSETRRRVHRARAAGITLGGARFCAGSERRRGKGAIGAACSGDGTDEAYDARDQGDQANAALQG